MPKGPRRPGRDGPAQGAQGEGRAPYDGPPPKTGRGDPGARNVRPARPGGDGPPHPTEEHTKPLRSGGEGRTPRPGVPRPPRPPGPPRPPRPPKPPTVLRLGNPRRRISIGLLAMTFVLSILSGRLVQLQGLDSKVYEARAAEQRVQPEILPARRGPITDAGGHELAITVEAREISVDPARVSETARGAVAAMLAKELARPQTEIAAKLAKTDTRYQLIARGVDPVVAQRVIDHDYRGVASKSHYRRVYPGDDLAGSLIGFVGFDGGGLAGLERVYDKVLAGRDGEQSIEMGRDGQRIPMTRESSKAPVPGREVRLTIDRDIQWAAQRAIARQVTATGARSGSVIIMDVRNGHVLGMANAPELDLNNWEKTPQKDWINRAVAEVYEPGSTNKVITAAAALEAGAVRPETVFNVRDNIRCADRVLRDSHAHKPERLTFSGIVATSSNVGTIMAAQKIGNEALHQKLRAFGFGVRPGSGLPGEEAGLLPAWQSWSGSQGCTVAYGQGVSVTALQMASVYQTIANGGVRITPQIVAGVAGEDGKIVPSKPGKRTRVVGTRTAEEIAGMLEAAVGEDGTGTLAAIPGYRVAGKTGTAMRYDEECQGYCGYTATFVGFTPADDPRIVALAVLQDPRNGHYGGQIAAPVFKDVMTFALKSRKIPPTGTTPPSVRIRADG
ncbi:penicillin-binding protein 2 [Spongiactinospora sp. TRM90649]|uniref:peptidoglycan D,D-transpeptidase FtsI family protein n=1 Tax=Spongiactinospora sp. TRM90649 TaxID=3031114 RepID=UPI0023F7C96A|nr:penicillin-binding protein 2 [Spongiactinospora sp. TRM90649]MDF5756857.1 penicillin-binding protein 2 [Spongiactinospora sp. TRM90649]